MASMKMQSAAVARKIYYVDISYAADGTPMASPAQLEVPSGAKVVWRGPESDTRQFKIDFPDSNPSGNGGLLDDESAGVDGASLRLDSKQTTQMNARSVSVVTNFNYFIEAPNPNVPGAMIRADPIIIIRP
ncbi:hypothetical protein IP90_01068 [Luteimonas cucumeris]|uniref:Uncharacterized protein n=1 Tax=Luteimonas cucumeris TaxID=985012 RepID=A0A562LBI1_9GAMM|nr:hypothetical protein [Luteimonas cucumeris]TWI04926.1 hypothetical protein IP90_01068 [Luteimonas cucumeris]